MMRFYEHHDPLPNSTTHIRILDILPGSKDQLLNLQSRVVELSDKAVYSAISYTWGIPKWEKVIWISGNGCAIPQNLWMVLCRIRHKQNVISVWVDALCIDQGNNDEKSSQVRLMGSIYAKAARTLVWLGPEADDSTELFEYINDYSSKPNSADSYPGKHIVNAVLSLCCREYWSRAWIRQEILHSRNKIVLCGPGEASWSDFCGCLQYSPLNSQVADTDVSVVIDNPLGLNIIDEKKKSLVPLRFLVETCGKSKASDVRDRIYALISLASDCQDTHNTLRPNYSLNRHEVFHKVLKFCRAEHSQEFRECLCEVLEITRERLAKESADYVLLDMVPKHPGERAFHFDFQYKGRIQASAAKSMSTDKLRSYYLNEAHKNNDVSIGRLCVAPRPGSMAKQAPTTGDRVFVAHQRLNETRWKHAGLLVRHQGRGLHRTALILMRIVDLSRSGKGKVLETDHQLDWLQADELYMEEDTTYSISGSALSRFLARLDVQRHYSALSSASNIDLKEKT